MTLFFKKKFGRLKKSSDLCPAHKFHKSDEDGAFVG
jgi:hypothetical protein